MLMYTLNSLLITDGVSNTVICMRLSDAVQLLKEILCLADEEAQDLDAVHSSEIVLAGHCLSYAKVNFAGEFIDFRVDGDLYLIEVTDAFIAGLKSHVDSLEVCNEY